MMRISLIVMALGLLLVGCAPLQVTPSPTVELTVTPESTATPVPTVTPVSTTAPAPTAISPPTPTSTATPPPTPTPPPIPTATAVPTPTPEPSPCPDIAPTTEGLPTSRVLPSYTGDVRPRQEWTADVPATFEEIEAELQNYRGQSLNVASWGGAYQAAQRQAYFLPFQEEFGIRIVEDSPIEFAEIGAMVETGNVTWDVVDLGVRSLYQRNLTGHLEELTPAIHGRYLPYFPSLAITPWGGGGGILWSTGLAYNIDSVDELWGGQKPQNWANFWDVERFPGKRSMGERVNENVFLAQMALCPEYLDNSAAKIAIAKLTEEQIDSSFAKLAEIEHTIPWWWTAGSDCPWGLLDREFDMCTAWNARIWNFQQEDGGGVLRYCYECGHLLQNDLFYIPKGSPNKTLAELFMAWTAKPEVNMQMAKYIPYGPINTQALPLIEERFPPDIASVLPTSPEALEKAVMIDEAWLGSNHKALTERMEALLAE